MFATTVRLDADIDLTTLGGRSGLLFRREGATLVGVGEALRIPVTEDVASVMGVLADLRGEDEVGLPGTGAVGFGAFAFDRDRTAELVVPRIVVGRDFVGRRWITTVGDSDSTAEAVEEVAGLADGPGSSGPEPSTYRLDATLAPEIWRDEVVGFARDRIRAGDLDKAVLARELTLRTDHPVDVAAVVRRLASSYPAAILFAVDGFVGASPELLVARTHDVVRAHPLAGTAPRASDPAVDASLSAELLASTKNQWEHRITIEWLLNTLLPFCSYVDAEPEPSIVSLANVHHLGTRVEGRLSSPPASILELVRALHPTPAVGGQPQNVALDLIEGLERADRGRYAGPVGWVDAEGNGAFAVGIRSAEISGSVARIFAGVGVVADSDLDAELEETRTKFRAMLGALLQP